MNQASTDDIKNHPLFRALKQDEESRNKQPEDDTLRKFRIQQSAEWLREEIHQFLSPKENGLALKLVDILEKEALRE